MNKTIKIFCYSCKKKHLMIMRKCPDCGIYETMQPKSDKVYENCFSDYACDGCISYRDHLGE